MKTEVRTRLLLNLTLLDDACPVKLNTCHMEFHISREARQRYQFDEELFMLNGNVIIANFHAARVFSKKMNDKKDVIHFPEKAVRAGQINAMGLIDEILHYVVQLYREQVNASAVKEAYDWLEQSLGKGALNNTLLRFIQEFPPLSVYQGKVDDKTYLDGKTEGLSNRHIILEELLLLWLANVNPAFSPFLELFDDESLEKLTGYLKIIDSLNSYFEKQPKFGPDNQNLIDMLRSPAIASPYSLTGQLDYIRRKWGILLGKYFYRLLRSLDLISEEEKARFLGAGKAQVYDFLGKEFEPERFSPDKDWMPRVVLMAKSTYVWLDQISKKYNRAVTRLDQIPDEELDQLARWGFTGLWLIGLWERSKASQKIKQLCGNPEAVASAYSLYEYAIAQELGGEAAFNNLKERAWQRGIRMAGDMVPNHMAIDSRWVIEHPHWFISLPYSPYPNHTFNGENLSGDQRTGIFIEDQYYNRTDASVVFKRVDFYTGETRYIYHGNDGTSMPWNDTAQLDYLKPELREAVIQTILHVARQFPIIRFDAAMTLTKKHYQRLWYPEPGSGGDIPTRAEHGLTRKQFNEAMPREFWREVVERVAQEIPDTLLLAEAFWLMEGYFVRTLGMHRVYNSAFMNMLKNEDNTQYRSSIKNILEFNPEILKRFVNFMNNPDEETAVAQFGKGDKYFGISIMLVTMPGLPMFGHGQVEGFTEKYGMEYRRAYWNEQPDWDLVRRHEREIFPLLHKRYLFAEVHNFYLFDFYTAEGHVNENVFAYSNKFHAERGLVVYHNKFENTAGWIKTSAAYSVKKEKSLDRTLIQKNLGEALDLPYNDRHYVIFRELISGLEFIRNSKSIHNDGLYVSLQAYQYQVFLDFRVVEDNIWNHYANLAAYLHGRGVPNIDEALKETFLRPLHSAFREVVNIGLFRELVSQKIEKRGDVLDLALMNKIRNKVIHLLGEIQNFTSGQADLEGIAAEITDKLETGLQLMVVEEKIKCGGFKDFKAAVKLLKTILKNNNENWYILFTWLLIHRLGKVVNPTSVAEESRSGLDEWLLHKIIEDNFYQLGLKDDSVHNGILLIRILTTHQQWWCLKNESPITPYEVISPLLLDTEARDYLQINRFRDVLWFNGEAFKTLSEWLFLIGFLDAEMSKIKTEKERCKLIVERYSLIRQIIKAQEKSEYQLENLLTILRE